MAANRSAFSGSRLRLARAFNGWTQVELGEQVGVSHQFIGYLEAGQKSPTDLLTEALGDACGFAPEFFHGPAVDEFRDEECHFRRRASTPVSVRTRVLAHGTLFSAGVEYLDGVLSLPREDVPEIRVSNREEIERAAESCRMRWGLGRDVPIKNLTRAVERAGVIVTRFEGSTTKVDAFSRSAGRRPIVVLNTEKDSPSRTRFDLAHECGHLVMHGGLAAGSEDAEREADQFASALLLPRAGFVREFPRGPRIDWAALFRLKRRWGASVAAIVRRAFDLRMIDAAQYQRAYKYMAAQGWRTGEPDEIEPELPEVIPLAIRRLEEHFGASPNVLCRRLQWRRPVFEKVLGVPLPPEEEDRPEGVVVNLALRRAERERN